MSREAANKNDAAACEGETDAFDPIAYLTTPRWQKVSLGLERTKTLLAQLGCPQDKLRFVHVAGTNGKGSTCAFVASILQRAGYRVGLFTSPALYSFEERICVNGEAISSRQLLEVTREVKSAADAMMDNKAGAQQIEFEEDGTKDDAEHPTEFELLTAVAFTYFEQCSCDIVVAEVGLGGRLDSTNVIETVEVSIITPLSFDHRALLGDTLEQIAREKAGIIKPHVPVVSAPQQPAALDAIEQIAHALESSLKVVDASVLSGTPACFSYRDRDNLTLGLSGTYQLVNAAAALDAIDALRAQGWHISEDAIYLGLRDARWPGRFEVVSESPLVIIDGGHNAAGAWALTRALDEVYPQHRKILITGVLKDKDHQEMAAVFVEHFEQIFTVTPKNPRALDARAYATELQWAAKDADRAVSIQAATSIKSGVQRALQSYDRMISASKASQECQSNEVVGLEQKDRPPLICVAGSLYLLSSVMEVLRQAGVAL